jgi:hypothetical protein
VLDINSQHLHGDQVDPPDLCSNRVMKECVKRKDNGCSSAFLDYSRGCAKVTSEQRTMIAITVGRTT